MALLRGARHAPSLQQLLRIASQPIIGRDMSSATTTTSSSSSSDSSGSGATAFDSESSFAKDLFNTKARADMTPSMIQDKLDKFIVGQADAKRAVAIALRNRWRRMQLPSPMREEVIPKNILMVGPTGCGKTEIARRLAKLADAPFIKVEATKYTELGYVGRDVEDIVKDLVEISINQVRTRMRQRLTVHTAQKAETAIVRGLVGEHADEQTVNAFRELYRRGLLDDKTVELAPPPADASKKGADVFSIMDLLGRADKGAGGLASPRKAGDESKKSMLVGDAKEQIEDQEAERLMQTDMVVKEAVRAAEQDGIIFIDEIDKIVDGGGARRFSGGSVSSEGVQRDLLPIIEGSVVQTKYGPVSTDHMLFICSGAFHSSKPSDMLAELQGRLPIRVELKGLTANDFHRILTEPENSLIKQQKALLATEGVELVVTEGAIKATAQLAEEANRLLDNIGARRLHTVLERVLADISYTASEKIEEERKAGKSTFSYVVDEAMVEDIIRPLLKKKDLSKYIL